MVGWSQNEYAQAMNEMDLGFTAAEMWALFGHFDRDNSGDIDYDEFIQGVQNQGERSLGGEQSKANMVRTTVLVTPTGVPPSPLPLASPSPSPPIGVHHWGR